MAFLPAYQSGIIGGLALLIAIGATNSDFNGWRAVLFGVAFLLIAVNVAGLVVLFARWLFRDGPLRGLEVPKWEPAILTVMALALLLAVALPVYHRHEREQTLLGLYRLWSVGQALESEVCRSSAPIEQLRPRVANWQQDVSQYVDKHLKPAEVAYFYRPIFTGDTPCGAMPPMPYQNLATEVIPGVASLAEVMQKYTD